MITLELNLIIFLLFLQLEIHEKGLTIYFLSQYLYSLIHRQREKRKRYFVLWVSLSLPIIPFFFLYLFWILLVSISISPNAVCFEVSQCLFLRKDRIMGTCPLSPHFLGHDFVTYFWKLFRISLYEALDIMRWIFWVHCLPDWKLMVCQSCEESASWCCV